MKLRKKRILLVSPYKNRQNPTGQYFAPSVGLFRIASFLRSEGYDIDVVDPDLEGVEILEKRILGGQYGIIGKALLYRTLQEDINLLEKIKRWGPKCVVVVGGQGVMHLEELLLDSGLIDFVVRGFGEFAFHRILKELEVLEASGMGSSASHNFSSLRRRIVTAEPYSPNEYKKLALEHRYEDVPLTTYWKWNSQALSIDRYWSFLSGMSRHSSATTHNCLRVCHVVTSSHCRKACAFCSSTRFLDVAYKKEVRPIKLSSDAIVRVIEKVNSAWPEVDYIWFNDDSFLQDCDRVSEFCKLISKNENNRIGFMCQGRIDEVNSPLLSTMARANFKAIFFGIESFSPFVLKSMCKSSGDIGCYLRKSIENLRQTIRSGIVPIVNLILFYPTARIIDILETIDMAMSLAAEGAQLSVTPYVDYFPLSRLANDRHVEFTYKQVFCGGKVIPLPDKIMPKDKEVLRLAARALANVDEELHSEAVRYGGVLPLTYEGLLTFKQILALCGQSVDVVTRLINSLYY